MNEADKIKAIDLWEEMQVYGIRYDKVKQHNPWMAIFYLNETEIGYSEDEFRKNILMAGEGFSYQEADLIMEYLEYMAVHGSETEQTVGDYTVTVLTGAEQGGWEYKGQEGGELIFKDKELVDYDGCSELHEDVIKAIESLGLNADYAKETYHCSQCERATDDLNMEGLCENCVLDNKFMKPPFTGRYEFVTDHPDVSFQEVPGHGFYKITRALFERMRQGQPELLKPSSYYPHNRKRFVDAPELYFEEDCEVYRIIEFLNDVMPLNAVETGRKALKTMGIIE